MFYIEQLSLPNPHWGSCHLVGVSPEWQADPTEKWLPSSRFESPLAALPCPVEDRRTLTWLEQNGKYSICWGSSLLTEWRWKWLPCRIKRKKPHKLTFVMQEVEKKNVAQEESSMCSAFWVICQACRSKIRGIQLLISVHAQMWDIVHNWSRSLRTPVCPKCTTYKYSHSGECNNDCVNLSVQILCLLSYWSFTQQNYYLSGRTFAKLDYTQVNKRSQQKKKRILW